MKYYPALLALKGKKCVVIGGGKVAQRKARSLVKTGASVRLISPVLTKGLKALKRSKKISCIKSGYQKKFLKNAFLVIAATGDNLINLKIAKDADKLRMLVNVVDSPDSSNFIVPAVLQSGDLIIGISTSGKAPALSKKIKEDLTKLIIPRYAGPLKLLEGIRKELKLNCPDPKTRKAVLARIINSLGKFTPGP